MRAASKTRRVAINLIRTALWFSACNVLAAVLAAQCSNPTQVPNQTDSSGTYNYSDNNALSASSVVVSGSASMTLVAGNCIQLLLGFHATAGTAATTFHAWVETAPTAVSVSPANGSGLSQPFTWTVSSPSGYGNLSDVYALFNTSVSGANACYIHYNRVSNLLFVADSTGSNWSSGIVPGSSSTTGTFSPNCTINGTGSSVSPSGNQLALTTSVTFQTTFSGTKNEYLIGYDNQGLNTTWQQFGTWTASTGGFTPIRISAGGPYTDSQGQYWAADYGYLQGSTYSTTASITGTADPKLYQTERYNYNGTPSTLTYQFSVPNGNYTVTLKFAEIYDTAAGQRYMNGSLNGTTVFSNLDVWTATGGPNRAYDLSYPVSVTSGLLTITLTCTSSNNSAEVNALQIVAGGSPQQYYLTTAVSPSGAGSISPASGWYNSGSYVTITASPASGYQFSGWTGVDSSNGTTGYVTMNGNRSVTANFTPTSTYYTLTTGVSPSGGGSVSPSCSGGCSYSSGSQVTVTATPASGYQFSGFTGSVNSSSNPLTVTMNNAMTVTANFTQTSTQYQLTTSANPSAGGSISPTCPGGCMYGGGSNVTLTAAPNAGYSFTSFSGTINSSSNPLTVTMNNAVTEAANFASTPPNISTISPTSGPAGTAVTITGSGFGAAQGSGTVSFAGTSASVRSWSPASIVALVPAGASSGAITVAISGFTPATSPTNFVPNTALSIVTTALQAATVGSPYSVTVAASGGTPPYSWSVLAGSLPPGLALTSSSGTIAGNPSALGTFAFTVEATDSVGATATQPLSLTVTAPTLSINGGSNTAEVAPSTNVSMAFNLYDQANGANDIGWAQFYLADSSGNAFCYGDWGRPNGLDLYDGNTGATWGFNQPQSDSFCTVSLVSITNSSSDPTEVTVVLNFNFNPGPGGTYTVLTQVNYGSGYAGPWEALGTLIIDPGHVTISGNATALGYPLVGATMSLSGSNSASVVTDSSGNYSFLETAGGNYTITPSYASLIFAPPYVAWNNLTTNQTTNFTALPPDYQTGSGLTSIPNSLTAADPVLTCDDISGIWDSVDSAGNEVGWNLTQTGTSISGQMSYDIVRYLPGPTDCGTATYNINNGSYDTNSLQFTLPATLTSSAYDACGYSVATQWTETVTLSGRACGAGAAQFDIVYPTSLSSTVAMVRRFPSSMSHSEQSGVAIQTQPARTSLLEAPAALQPRPADNQGSSTWTTVSPRFTVQYSAYIPVDQVSGPTACTNHLPYGLLLYEGDAFRRTYRTTESLLVVPGPQKYSNVFARGGPTRNYQVPSSPANGFFANLSSTPTGDPWRDPYSGADEDNVQYDCHLWNNKDEASNAGMRGVNVTFGNPVTQVNLFGQGSNPLESPSAAIKWNLVISLDTTDPANPKAWVSGSTETCYPAHVVKVNGTVVYQYVPCNNCNNVLYLAACLTGSGSPVSPSSPTSVPAH
jgi:uncharacterized repeat protein (TIGR02543 family)